MKKLLVVIIILGIAAFIYYSEQNFFQKNRLRRTWENQIEDITGLDDVDLKNTLRTMEDLQDWGADIINDREFQRALRDLSDNAKEKLQEMDRDELNKMMEELRTNGERYRETLEEYLGD